MSTQSATFVSGIRAEIARLAGSGRSTELFELYQKLALALTEALVQNGYQFSGVHYALRIPQASEGKEALNTYNLQWQASVVAALAHSWEESSFPSDLLDRLEGLETAPEERKEHALTELFLCIVWPHGYAMTKAK